MCGHARDTLSILFGTSSQFNEVTAVVDLDHQTLKAIMEDLTKRLREVTFESYNSVVVD